VVLFGNPVPGRIGAPGNPDPSSGFVVTSPFGPRGDGFHDGLDIDNGGPAGDPILAMRDGTVYQSFTDAASGGANIIRIDHGDGWTTGYAHMQSRYVVKGDRVSKGQTIGTLGETGWATGPHLHMDTSYQNERRDPWPMLEQNAEEDDPLQWLNDARPYTALVELEEGQPLRTSPQLSNANIGTTLTAHATLDVAAVVHGDEYAGSSDWYAYPLKSGGWYTFAKSQAARITPIDYDDAIAEPPPDPCAMANANADRANLRAALVVGLALLIMAALVVILLLR
jgi:murein DD-endopeptidase MepM/ murein hydrolase activator NlpD